MACKSLHNLTAASLSSLISVSSSFDVFWFQTHRSFSSLNIFYSLLLAELYICWSLLGMLIPAPHLLNSPYSSLNKSYSLDNTFSVTPIEAK